MKTVFTIDSVFDAMQHNSTQDDCFIIDGIKIQKNKKMKFFFRNKDKLFCTFCKKKATNCILKFENDWYYFDIVASNTSLTVDHIIPTAKLGRCIVRYNNKQILCKSCNKKKKDNIHNRKIVRDWKKELLYQSYITYILTTIYANENAFAIRNFTKNIFKYSYDFFEKDFDYTFFDFVYEEFYKNLRKSLLKYSGEKITLKNWYDEYMPNEYLTLK